MWIIHNIWTIYNIWIITIFEQCITCFYRILHTYNLYIKYNLYNVSIYSISVVNDHTIVNLNSSNVVHDQIVVNCPNVVKHPTVVNCPYKWVECSKCSFTLKYLYQTTKILIVDLGIAPKVWWFFFLHFITTFGSFTTVGQFRTSQIKLKVSSKIN
jgi:hypothetical protein